MNSTHEPMSMSAVTAALSMIHKALEHPGSGILLAQDGPISLFQRSGRFMLERDGVTVLTLEDKELAFEIFAQLIVASTNHIP